MAAHLTANHNTLYFDNLRRTNKAETVLALILSTYRAKEDALDEEGTKKRIALLLKSAYEILLPTDPGRTYDGSVSSFESQYTIGHELCIWKNSTLDLTDLAAMVAKNEITIQKYFDVVFLNYIQPINNTIVHILYHLLDYMDKNNLTNISKKELGNIYKDISGATDEGNVNGAYNMLISTSYFVPDNNGKELKYVASLSIKQLKRKCDITYVEKGYDAAKEELNTSDKYIQYILNTHEETNSSNENKQDIVSCESKNKIYFGAPGTGKSYRLEQERKALLGNNNAYERVTFHPDYSYANFVGTYKPVVKHKSFDSNLDPTQQEILTILQNKNMQAQDKYDALYEKFKNTSQGITRIPLLLGLYTDEEFVTRKNDGSDGANSMVERNHGKAIRPYVNLDLLSENSNEITYEYVPGPFMRILAKALKSIKYNTNEQFLLIIEEINRANMAAVFGDIFQLLDRNEFGESEYAIATSNEMRYYLSKEIDGNNQNIDKYAFIKIPSNMHIWATMNSADQGVFPMDTAFKRRWDFEYLNIDNNKDEISDFSFEVSGEKTNWNSLRVAINEFLTSQDMRINEDKLLGPFFINKKCFANNETFIKTFKDKVLMYLYEDVAKQQNKRNILFSGVQENILYSKLCDEFGSIGIRIFNDNIVKKVTEV